MTIEARFVRAIARRERDRMAAVIVRVIDQDRRTPMSRISKVILVGRSIMPSIMYDGGLLAVGASATEERMTLANEARSFDHSGFN
jgi:hypothetical protein